MNYGFTKLATDWNDSKMDSFGIRLTKTLLFFIKKGNPDQEKLYPKVAKWLIEIDESGVPVREIGLDENNNALFSAPNNHNFGFWTDSDKKFGIEELERCTKEEFESFWLSVEQKA